MSSNLKFQLRSMNVKAGEHRRSELCGLDVTISARYDWPVACLFHYVIGISGILPYNRNVTLQTFFRSLEIFTACTVLTHGSIMLPPRQPRVFARLARWQLQYTCTAIWPDQCNIATCAVCRRPCSHYAK